MKKFFFFLSIIYFFCTFSTTVQAQTWHIGLWEYRQLKKCLTSENHTKISSLSLFLTEMKERVHITPLTYYFSQYKLSSLRKDTGNMVFNLAMCDYICGNIPNLSTKRDHKILNNLLEDGYLIENPYNNERLIELTKIIDKKKSQFRNLEILLRDVLDSLRQEYDELVRKRETLSKNLGVKTLSIRLANLEKDYEAAMRNINNLVGESEINNSRLEGNSNLKIMKGITASNSSAGYSLGQHCADETKFVIQKIANAILRKVKLLGNKNISISMTITGKSDGHSYGRNIGKYTGKRIEGKYFIKENSTIIGNERNVVIANRDISNIELAFLRAYCVYEQFYEVLNGKVNLETPTFYTSEFQQKGEAYRGVEIELTIENLFKHNRREIDSLNNEIRKKGKEISKIQEQLNRCFIEKGKYQLWLDDIDLNKSDSRIQREINYRNLNLR